MTKPSILPQLPFFSVDSISWKMGEIYGVTYIWDGRKFHTIVKTKKWEARRRYKQKLLAQGCNWDLYMEDDNNEVTRMNAVAWVEVEKWIQHRLKQKMYWFKGTLKLEGPSRGKHESMSKKAEGSVEDIAPKKLLSRGKKEANNAEEIPDSEDEVNEDIDLIVQTLDDIQFVEPDWFKGAKRDLDEQCKKVNINPEAPMPVKLSAIEDLTILCSVSRGDTDYLDHLSKYTRDYIEGMCVFYFKVPLEDENKVLEDLIAFFEEVATGTNAFFYTEEFDNLEGDAPPEPLERQEYVMEDLDEDEKQMEAAIVALENAGIPKVRDAAGRFLPGHYNRKPKNIYSAKYPKLACDTCYAAQSCPKFQSGYICAFSKMFERYNLRDPQDILDQLYSMTELNGQRLQRVALFETLEGGAIDPNVSGLIQMQVSLLKELQQVMSLSGRQQASLINPEMEINIKTTNAGNGILSKLFSMPPTPQQTAEDDDDIREFDYMDKDMEQNVAREGATVVKKSLPSSTSASREPA